MNPKNTHYYVRLVFFIMIMHTIHLASTGEPTYQITQFAAATLGGILVISDLFYALLPKEKTAETKDENESV